MIQTKRFVFAVLLASLLVSLFALTGCAQKDMDANSMPLNKLPDKVRQAPVTVQEAYQFAISNPDALKAVPCFCGCGAAGHTSNYNCFIKEVKSNGEIAWDWHALGCSICVDIARDVMRMTKDGKPIGEIQAAIDQTYAKYGPSNMVPAP